MSEFSIPLLSRCRAQAIGFDFDVLTASDESCNSIFRLISSNLPSIIKVLVPNREDRIACAEMRLECGLHALQEIAMF